MIYLDNAATSHPKPKETLRELNRFVKTVGGNPGRGGHTASVDAARIVFETRERLAAFINGSHSERLIFTQNGTESLNLAIIGFIRPSDHVITTSMEHNSVMRPLSFLEHERNVKVSIVPCSPRGELDPDDIRTHIRKETRAIIINHGSNVTGTVQDIGAVKRLAGDIPVIVDACQTIGSFPIDVEKDNIDILCFSCHKSLYALQGLGAVYIRPGIDPLPLKFGGGTGSRSESMEQPLFLPDRYESGTPNTPGIASLLGGLTFIEKTGLDAIRKKEHALTGAIVRGLRALQGATVYGNHGPSSLPVVSFNIEGILPSDVGQELNRQGIYARVGLQCSPAAHKTIGSFPAGTVRVSPGYFTTRKEVATFLEVIEEIARA